MITTDRNLASDLVQAIITVINDGNQNSSLGRFLGVGNLTDKQIDELRSLSEADKNRLVKSGGSLISVTINNRNMSAICSMLDADRARNQLIEELITAHASYPMMLEMFGTSSAEMAQLRRNYQVVESGGRPTALSERQECELYSLHKLELSRFSVSNEQYADAVLCLRIYRKARSRIPISKIYKFIRELNNV